MCFYKTDMVCAMSVFYVIYLDRLSKNCHHKHFFWENNNEKTLLNNKFYGTFFDVSKPSLWQMCWLG